MESRQKTPQAAAGQVTWKLFTNHAHVLLRVAVDPDMRLREIAQAVGITERRAHQIVSDLVEGGCISRRRIGRRNSYRVNNDALIHHLETVEPVAEDHPGLAEELTAALIEVGRPSRSKKRPDGPARSGSSRPPRRREAALP